MMKLNPRLKGYLFSLLAAVSLSNVYIFSKAALKEIQLAQFMFYWFGFGVLWNLIYAYRTDRIKKIKLLDRKAKFALVWIGVLEVGATFLFFIAINIIENPAIVAFIANMTPVFVTVLGISVLHERFNYVEILGLILTLGGTFVISYKGDAGLVDFFIPGTGYILLSGVMYAVATIIAKSNIKNIDPTIMSLNRVLYLFGASLIGLLIMQDPLLIKGSALLNTFIGSMLGPFLTAVATYTALRYIEASKSILVRSSRNIFVLLGAYLFFDVFPEGYQLIGAAISVTGVIMITLGKKQIPSVPNQIS
jgi:drug/metabolite transporter (DMT)-like permease